MSAPTEPRVNVDEVNGFVVVPPKDEINLTKIRTSKVTDDDHLTQAQGTQITNGLDSGTFRKKSSKQRPRDESILSRQHVLQFIQSESLFDDQHHCAEIEILIRSYIRQVRRREILTIFDDKMFDEEENMEEVSNMMQKFIREKTSNNNNISVIHQNGE